MADDSWARTPAPPSPCRAPIWSTPISIICAPCIEASERAVFRSRSTAPTRHPTVAPELFNSLGFETIVIGNRPDGRNINLRSGSTHPGGSPRQSRAAARWASRSTATAIAIFVDLHGRSSTACRAADVQPPAAE
jgi:hypothetical protein